MIDRKRRSFALLPTLAVAWTLSGCEIAVDVNAALDASPSTSIDCSICADVSVDANYDAPDVSIYGRQPAETGSDAGSDAHEAETGVKDAAHLHD
jgi:hypothetical protein